MTYVVRKYFGGGGWRVIEQFKQAHDAETYITHLATSWCEYAGDDVLAWILETLVEAVGGHWERLPEITRNTLASDLVGDGISVGLLAALAGDSDVTEEDLQDRIRSEFDYAFDYWGIVDEEGGAPENVAPVFAGPNVLLGDGKVKFTVHYG